MSLRANFANYPNRLWRWALALLLLSAASVFAQDEPDESMPPPMPEPIEEGEAPPIEEPVIAAPAPSRTPTRSRVLTGRSESSQPATTQSLAAPALTNKAVDTIVMHDQDLPSVLLYLEKLTGRPIIRSQNLPAVKITFDSIDPMTVDEAITVIKSLLALNGIIITDMGDNLKAVPATGGAGASAQIPNFLEGSALDLPPSTEFYTKLFRFNYLEAKEEGLTIVSSLSSGGGAPVPLPKSNSLLVTDMLINLQRMEQVLETADVPNYDNENIFFFSLRHIKASDLAQRLTKLTTSNSGISRYFNHNTTFEADERTNQLIVITHPSNKPILDNLVAELDKDVEPITSSEVFYIKHAQSTELQALLKEVITGQQNAREKSESAKKDSTGSPESRTAPGAGGEGSLAADAAPMPSATEGISGVVEIGKNLQFSDFVTVVADERSNAIVAYGTKSDLIQIERLIEQIDVLLAQVYIEVLIAEVTLTDDTVSGFSAFNISGTRNVATTLLNPATGLSVGGTGNTSGNLASPFDFTATLNPDDFSMVIRQAASDSNVRILSVPNIVTTHNQEANVNVSQSQPIITSTVQNLATGSTDGTTSNDVQYRDIGIQLTVKPLIGSNGIIQMEIEQVVENVVRNTTINGIDQPIIGKREATSFVSVSDGEVIVLAGLQETLFNTSEGKLWLLGYIPLIGDLLNPESETNERRELMIFIRPTVYFGSEQAYAHAKEKLETLDNGPDVEAFLRTDDMTEVTKEQRVQAGRVSDEIKKETLPITRPLEQENFGEEEAQGDIRDLKSEEATGEPAPVPTTSDTSTEDNSVTPYRSPYRGH